MISDELGRLLDKVDEKISKLIFGEVDKICFESSVQMYEVALRILNKLSSTNGKTTGAYFTNVSISKLEKSLLDCKEDMLVYDGFCGCGVSANEVANHKGIVFLQDSQLMLTGKLWTYLADLNEICVERRDTMMGQIMEAEGVTEELKGRDQMEWLRRVNNIRNRVDEVILNETLHSNILQMCILSMEIL